MPTKKLSSNNRLIVKGLLISAVAAGIYFIPGNAGFIYGYGESSVLPGSTTLPKECNSQKPAAPVFYQPVAYASSQAAGVRLNWVKVANADKYTIGYGVSSGNYIYGVSNTGNTDNFTVNYLTPGKKYYFAVRGVNDCTPGSWSHEWSVVVGGGSSNVTTATTPYTYAPLQQNNQNQYQQPTKSANNYVAPTTVQNNPYVPPAGQPAPVQQPGFFQSIINFFKGLFGGR
jgi:hypothetical protein